MSRDFVGALLQLNAEKQVSREQLINAVEDGIQSAYRRVAGDEDIHVRIDPETGKIRVFRARTAVAEVEDPLIEFSLEDARTHKPDAEIGDLVEMEELDGDVFGRIGAQTAKQIVLQRIREVERDQVFDKFASREGEMITGAVNRVEPRAIILDVGNNVEAILATSEQSAVEHYRIGQNVKAYVLEVRRSTRGPQILVSRTHKGFLKRLFELEVPEIHSGTVEIRAIAREAGSRSKVAVASRQEGLDPGRCHGRPARRPRPGRRRRARRREDRRHPVERRRRRVRRQRAEPGPGDLRRHRRGAPDRERDGSRADALAGDRPRGPERPARRAADRLADRHPERRLGRRGEGRRRRGGQGAGHADARAMRPALCRRPATAAAAALDGAAAGEEAASRASRRPRQRRRPTAAEPSPPSRRPKPRRRSRGRRRPRATEAAAEPAAEPRRSRPTTATKAAATKAPRRRRRPPTKAAAAKATAAKATAAKAAATKKPRRRRRPPRRADEEASS